MSDRLEAVSILKEILKFQISNLGCDNKEFYTCYTMGGKMPDWVQKAKDYIEMTKDKRAAQFTLPIDFVESGEAGKLFAFMEFTPVRVECLHYAMKYEFVGLSPIFEEVEYGCMYPTVELKIVHDVETGEIKSVEIMK